MWERSLPAKGPLRSPKVAREAPIPQGMCSQHCTGIGISELDDIALGRRHLPVIEP